MKLTYDPAANVAYICLREQQGDVEMIEVTSDVLVGIDKTGKVCGVELLNAQDQLAEGDGGNLVLFNRASGNETVLRVA